jgi:alpha-glucosidase
MSSSYRFVLVLIAMVCCLGRPQAFAQAPDSLQVTSPNGALIVTIGTGERLTYAVRHRGRDLVLPSPLGLTLADGTTMGAKAVVSSSKSWTVNQVLKPVVRIKRAEVRDHFNARRIDFTGRYSLIVHAYDDGIAWRFVTSRPGELTVKGEDATFRFAADHELWFPEEESLLSPPGTTLQTRPNQ